MASDAMCKTCLEILAVYNKAIARGDRPAAEKALAAYDEHRGYYHRRRKLPLDLTPAMARVTPFERTIGRRGIAVCRAVLESHG
jgi:hypothetical protein